MVPSTTEMQTRNNDPKTEKIVLPTFPKSIYGSDVVFFTSAFNE